MSSEPVLSRALEGDSAAISELVRLYHDRVYRFGVRVCRDEFDADDAVQSAFVTLARRPDVQKSPQVAAWLFQVVKNACLAFLKRAGLQRRVSLSDSREGHEVPAASLSAEAALERFELVSQVHQAIDRLPRNEREVLILRDLEGLTGEAAAERLGISLPAVKSRLFRARTAVREHVEHLRGPH